MQGKSKEPPTTLDLIARGMQIHAQRSPFLARKSKIAHFRHMLTGGLILEYLIDARTGERRLALVRPRVFPSEKEVEIVRAAFQVPETNVRIEHDEGRGTREAYRIIRLRWGGTPLFEHQVKQEAA